MAKINKEKYKKLLNLIKELDEDEGDAFYAEVRGWRESIRDRDEEYDETILDEYIAEVKKLITYLNS